MRLRKAVWQIVLSSNEIDLDNPTKEELIDLITAALPYRELESQLIRLASHIVKESLYSTSKRSWTNTIKDSVLKIKRYNTRRKAKGTYFTVTEMKAMLRDEWDNVLVWVAKESDGQFSKEQIKKKVSFASVWAIISQKLT